MESYKKFSTKTGYCYVLPDRLVLVRSGFQGKITEVVSGNTISRLFLIYGILFIYLIYKSVTSYSEGETMMFVIHTIIALLVFINIIFSFNKSATPLIIKDKIREIKFVGAKPGLTRACFSVIFENEKGVNKKRLIMLPGSLSGKQEESTHAIGLMRDEGYTVI